MTILLSSIGVKSDVKLAEKDLINNFKIQKVSFKKKKTGMAKFLKSTSFS